MSDEKHDATSFTLLEAMKRHVLELKQRHKAAEMATNDIKMDGLKLRQGQLQFEMKE